MKSYLRRLIGSIAFVIALFWVIAFVLTAK